MALLTYVFLLVCAALAEATAGYQLDALGGGRLNLVLVLVTAWSLVRGPLDGLLVGLAGGLVLDLMSGAPFGLHTILLGMLGAATAIGGGTLERGGLALLFGTTVFTTIAYHGLMVLILRLFGWDFPGLMRFVNVLVPTIILNVLFMPVAAALARRVDRLTSSWRRMEVG